MKLLLFVIIITFTLSEVYSQFSIPGIIKRKVEEKVEQKTEEAVERVLEGEDENSEEMEGKKELNKNIKSEQPISLKTYSKFDFIPGENVIFYEDYQPDAVGDFPARWNTNGSGEVVTMDNIPGKWLKISPNSYYVPDIKYPFPENYTLEFDIIAYFDNVDKEILSHKSFGWFKTEMTSMANPKKPITGGEINSLENAFLNSFEFEYRFGGESRFYIINNFNGDEGGISNDIEYSYLKGLHAVPIHISIAVNKQRFRVWVNQNKVYDIPRFFTKDLANIIRFSTYNVTDEHDYQILIGNVRFAAAKQDDRSKLITEGKIVTNAIKFDTGSDKLKPESYSTIKSIADVLKKKPDVRIRIIGHTDTDGTAEKNLILSKQRAESVKQSLVDEFQIDESRIETDGKGDSEPVADNGIAEGKAQNRRVEFIKL